MSLDLQHELTARLSHFSSVWISPDIPKRKLQNARSVHGHQLPADEPIIALYDDTLFGNAQCGFLLTTRRIYWKNLLEGPQQISWQDLNPRTISAESQAVNLAGGTITIIEDGLPGVLRDLLFALAAPQAPTAGDLSERIRRLALERMGKVAAVFYASGIPPKKQSNARSVHQLSSNEPIIVLYDDTVFGSAEDGFVITAQRLCWKNIVESPGSRRWVDLSPSEIHAEGNTIHIGESTISLTSPSALPSDIARLLQEVAAMVQGKELSSPTSAESREVERCQYCGMRLLHIVATCPGCSGPV